MSISIVCDKCKEQGTKDNPVYYVESVLTGIPILESLRDLETPLQRDNSFSTPCTLHLHGSCAIELQELLSQRIKTFIEPPKENRSGKKKKNKGKDA